MERELVEIYSGELATGWRLVAAMRCGSSSIFPLAEASPDPLFFYSGVGFTTTSLFKGSARPNLFTYAG